MLPPFLPSISDLIQFKEIQALRSDLECDQRKLMERKECQGTLCRLRDSAGFCLGVQCRTKTGNKLATYILRTTHSDSIATGGRFNFIPLFLT